jgi:hypothetical protein
VIAERLGWHMRKIRVGSRGIEYDYIVYDSDDRYVYQQEITAADLDDEPGTAASVWLAAMTGDNCPRWDENLNDATWLVIGLDYKIWREADRACAWVGTPQYSACAAAEALALVRAWLAYTSASV